MDKSQQITKEQIAKEYDAIADKIGLDNTFYDLCLAMTSFYGHDVLDIGCGRGSLLQRLHGRHPRLHLTGIDISPKLCAIAAAANPGARIIRGDAEQLPFKDNSFDFVFMTETLEHMLDFEVALSELVRVLKPGGQCVLSVPNRDWASYAFYDKIRNKSLQPVDDHYFRFQEIRALLEAHVLRTTKVRGSDNLYYYGAVHRLERVAAMVLPILHKKMKRLVFLCTSDKHPPL